MMVSFASKILFFVVNCVLIRSKNVSEYCISVDWQWIWFDNFQLRYSIFLFFGHFLKINFTGADHQKDMNAIKIDYLRLSQTMPQNILSDDQSAHSSPKTRIRSDSERHFFRIAYVNSQKFIRIWNIYEFDVNVTQLKWPRWPFLTQVF